MLCRLSPSNTNPGAALPNLHFRNNVTGIAVSRVLFLRNSFEKDRHFQSWCCSEFIPELPVHRREDITRLQGNPLVLLSEELRYLLMIEIGGSSSTGRRIQLLTMPVMSIYSTQLGCQPEYFFLVGLPNFIELFRQVGAQPFHHTCHQKDGKLLELLYRLLHSTHHPRHLFC